MGLMKAFHPLRSGCAYGSLIHPLFSHIDTFYLFSCCRPTHNLHFKRPYLSSRARPSTYQSSTNLQPHSTPRTPPLPRLPSIPILPLFLPQTAPLFTQVVVLLSFVSVISREGVDEPLDMMGIVEREEVMNRVKREGAWGPISRFQNGLCLTTRYSSPTLHPLLFDHDHAHYVQDGYAYASPPSIPIYARRSTCTQFEYPKVRKNPRRWCMPATADPTPQPNPALPPDLAPPERVPEHLPRRPSRVNAGSAIACAHMDPAIAPPYQGRVSPYAHPSRLRLRTRGIVYRRLGMRTRPLRVQTPILTRIGTSAFRPPSVAALVPPALAAAALPRNGTTHNDARLGQRTAGLLHDPRARDGLPQRPQTHRSLAEERHQARSGKAGNAWASSRGGRFRTFIPLEEPHSHSRAGSSASSNSGRN